MLEWKMIALGTKTSEMIFARLTPGGLIEKVASGYPSRQGYFYKLYPTSYKGYNTISKAITVSIRDIDFGGKE